MGSKILMTDINSDPTAANFPALKYAFTYDGCDFVNKTITCPISGMVLTASSLTDNGDGTFTPNTVTLSKNLVAPHDGISPIDMSLVMVAPTASNNTGTRFGMGDQVAGAGMVLAPEASWVTLTNSANYHDIPASNLSAAGALDYCGILAISWSGDTSRKTQYDAGLSSIAQVQGVTAGAGISAGITQAELEADNKLILGSPSYTGLYIFHWTDGIPDDDKQAAAWMGVNHRLYPGWLGRA